MTGCHQGLTRSANAIITTTAQSVERTHSSLCISPHLHRHLIVNYAAAQSSAPTTCRSRCLTAGGESNRIVISSSQRQPRTATNPTPDPPGNYRHLMTRVIATFVAKNEQTHRAIAKVNETARTSNESQISPEPSGRIQKRDLRNRPDIVPPIAKALLQGAAA